MRIHTILVPCDFSEHSERAFAWAVDIAEKHKAKLLLVHILSLLPQVLALPQDLLDAMEKKHTADAEQHLQASLAKCLSSKNIAVETAIRKGDPFREICGIAETQQPDLIVMGSRGRTGLAHVLMGSVAERIVRHAPCPVLVTR